MLDWKVFQGNADPHDGLTTLPEAPPWRFSRNPNELKRPAKLDLDAERSRALPFLPTPEMVIAVNAALYLRRPLLLTGKPGTGKSTLISRVAYELKLGPVIRWPINSRATVRSGVYEYDAVGRLQSGEKDPPVEEFLTLGPLGTALMAQSWPRALLVDEIDKSDLDFANDLLNVIEEGAYEIPELRRLGKQKKTVRVRDWLEQAAEVAEGRLVAGQFPFVVMTSNAEREFPAPFLRRCVRLHINPPDAKELARIVSSHLKHYAERLQPDELDTLIKDFEQRRIESHSIATDQLLNAVFLTLAMRDETRGRTFSNEEIAALRENLLQQLTGPAA